METCFTTSDFRKRDPGFSTLDAMNVFINIGRNVRNRIPGAAE